MTLDLPHAEPGTQAGRVSLDSASPLRARRPGTATARAAPRLLHLPQRTFEDVGDAVDLLGGEVVVEGDGDAGAPGELGDGEVALLEAELGAAEGLRRMSPLTATPGPGLGCHLRSASLLRSLESSRTTLSAFECEEVMQEFAGAKRNERPT
ncbi:MAG: hypothetical protein AB1700_13360 [Bacillota bacterium]